LQIGESRIYYEEAGAGEAVLLIHDGLASSVTWDNEWTTLSKRFHVIRYDRRGYGLSDPPTKPFAQWEDIYSLLRHLEVLHTTVVGCSSGGGVAIDFTLQHPEMVDRLILIGSVLHGMVVTKHFTDRGTKNNKPLANGDIKMAALNWSNDPQTILPSHMEARTNLYNALTKYPQNLKYTGEYEIRPMVPAVRRLGEIHVPTLILVGQHDIQDVQAFGGAIQAGIPGARREMVKDAAHLIPFELPVYLSERIIAFINHYPIVKVSEDVLKSYTGEYKLWDEPVKVVLRNGILWLNIPEEWEIPIYPLSDNTFRLFIWTQDAKMEFVRDSGGKIIEARIVGEDGFFTQGSRL
jgi:3-oxoadipate enol-lactonase